MMMGITVPHLHLLLNHIPTVGGAAALVLLLVAFARKSNDLKRIALEATYVVALLTFPSYLSGVGAQQTLLKMPEISQAFVDAHWNAALFTFVLMQMAGALAWLTLWKYRRNGTWSAPIVTAIFILSALSFAAAARTAALGGDIRHPEILAVAPAAAEGEPAADAQTAPQAAAPEGTETAAEPAPTGLMTGRGLGRSVMDRNWVWPASEALHFIGLWLILGIILIVNLRLLGFMPSVPYSAVHRLLPWAALGLLINVVTGMVFVTATPDQYGENISFLWKIIFLMVAGLDLLYITVFEGPWHVEAGQTPPLRVKIAGATAIIGWVGVMYFGRMLPFLGNAF
jgi:hypothetical protein